MTRREFHFVEGTSSKFWAVSVDGTAMTVQFGKIGTAGQTQQKTFPSPEKAKAEAEKLIGEKTRKGYKEVGTSAAAPPSPAPKPAAPKPAAAAPSERRLLLEPADWLRARWRERPAVPAPAPPA